MSVLKIIDVVGASPNSWEEAASRAIAEASELPIFKRDVKIADAKVKGFDIKVEGSRIVEYLCRVEIFLEY
jgi:hypothetical protein